MATALAQHLPHFALHPPRRIKPAPEAPVAADTAQASLEDLLAAAREEGRVAGLEEARIRFDAELEEERAGFAFRIEEQHQLLNEQVADRMGEQIAREIDRAAATVGDHVGAVLRPLVDTAVRDRAVAEVVGVVKRLLTTGDALTFRVSGPEALIERMRERDDLPVDRMTFEAAETADLVVAVDETVIETGLGAWQDLMGRAGGDD